MSIEAMKQALDALEDAQGFIECELNRRMDGGYKYYAEEASFEKNKKAIIAIRQAIQESSENGLYREGYRNGYGFGESAGFRQAIEQAEKPCNSHPDAPHGFVKGASINSDEYVCECHSWTPPDQNKEKNT